MKHKANSRNRNIKSNEQNTRKLQKKKKTFRNKEQKINGEE